MQSLVPHRIASMELVGQEWMPAVFPKAPLFRRVLADLIDRIAPLPILAYFFPAWAVVCLLFELLRDMNGRSPGKRLLGLRTVVVSANPDQHGAWCNVGRSLLRNAPFCLARLCYLSAILAPIGFAYDVLELGLVAYSPQGRRLGDWIAGTQVTTEAKP